MNKKMSIWRETPRQPILLYSFFYLSVSDITSDTEILLNLGDLGICLRYSLVIIGR